MHWVIQPAAPTSRLCKSQACTLQMSPVNWEQGCRCGYWQGEDWRSLCLTETLFPVLDCCGGQTGPILLGNGIITVCLGPCFCEARTSLPYLNKGSGLSGLSSAVHGAQWTLWSPLHLSAAHGYRVIPGAPQFLMVRAYSLSSVFPCYRRSCARSCINDGGCLTPVWTQAEGVTGEDIFKKHLNRPSCLIS